MKSIVSGAERISHRIITTLSIVQMSAETQLKIRDKKTIIFQTMKKIKIQRREWNKKYYQTHKEEYRERTRKYRLEHLDELKAYYRMYYESKKFDQSLCGSIAECLNCSKERCVYEV